MSKTAAAAAAAKKKQVSYIWQSAANINIITKRYFYNNRILFIDYFFLMFNKVAGNKSVCRVDAWWWI